MNSISKNKKLLNLRLVIIKKIYKILFTKSYTSSWSEEVSVITKVKNAIPWSNIINDFNVL